MGMRNQNGFTIIEVVLFFAVTGLLAAGLLGGWTAMIDNQRYKDSVKTLQSFLQQQYNLVYNVQNGRAATSGCTKTATGPVFGGSTNNPGQSDCIVMGRYIHVTNGNEVKVYPIVGIDKDNSANRANGDVWLIKDRRPKFITGSTALSESQLSIPWGADVVKTGGSTALAHYTIAIVRSPETGAVHTYTEQQSDATSMPLVENLVSPAAANTSANLCINPKSRLVGYRIGVVVRADASSQSSVQVLTDEDGPC